MNFNSENFVKDIKPFIDKINPSVYLKFKINRIKHQSVSSENCGYFAMKFLMDRFNGKPWQDGSGYSDVRELKNLKIIIIFL